MRQEICVYECIFLYIVIVICCVTPTDIKHRVQMGKPQGMTVCLATSYAVHIGCYDFSIHFWVV